MHLTRYGIVVLAAPVLVATLACARRPVATETRPASVRQASASGPSNILGIGEMRRASGATALEIIQHLRPQYLRSRGPLHAPTVFVDFMRRGGTEALREIRASGVEEIQYLDGREATQRFGSGYTGGIIHVLTKRTP